MNDIIVRRLWKAYGDKQVLADFSARIPAGQITCLMGPSGCGKTTLLRILLGLETADAGTIENVPALKSVVFQENRLFEDFSALSNCGVVIPGRQNKQTIVALLSALGLTDSLEKPVRSLSGGMKRRVAIARALLAPGELLIMDEPFSGLDENTKHTVLTCVKDHVKGKTILFITHDPAERDFLADQVIFMSQFNPALS